MRFFSLAAVLLGLLAARPAFAQSDSLGAAGGGRLRQAELPARSLATAVVPAPDTAAALHRLFAQHRVRRLRFTLGTLAVGTALTIMPAVSAKHASDPLDAGFSGFGAILAGSLTATLVPLELLHNNQYTRRRERQALADWQAHRLAPDLRRRLTARYFEPRGPGRP